jgi:hypothetical protein
MFRSSILSLMIWHFYERVDKWTHEPQSFSNKLLSAALLPFAILALIKSENTKNTFTFCNYTENPTTLLYNINFSLLSVICFSVILFTYTYFKTLCLTITRWSWGHKIRNLFCRLLDENGKSFFDCSPRVWY